MINQYRTKSSARHCVINQHLHSKIFDGTLFGQSAPQSKVFDRTLFDQSASAKSLIEHSVSNKQQNSKLFDRTLNQHQTAKNRTCSVINQYRTESLRSNL
jgi:hypothetical protein